MNALDAATIASPKRKQGGAEWYDYYAGYSVKFTEDILKHLAPSESAPLRVLDPWNGSGTTTAVAAKLGHTTIGVDRNPALVIVAKGRHLAISSVDKSLDPLRSEILTVAKSMTRSIRANNSEGDELRQWFTPTAVARIRAVERAIYRVLVDEEAPLTPTEPVSPQDLSLLASFFYSVLFTVTRRLTTPFRTTNPTWVRGAQRDEDCIEVPWSMLEPMLGNASSTLLKRLTIRTDKSPQMTLLEGSAEDLDLDQAVDIVLSSPPYCTRIDYIIATLPELAVLAHDADDIKHLRKQMLGTPLTAGVESTVDPTWGETASAFMGEVYSHASKAASTYYFRYYVGYLKGLYESLISIDRNISPDGSIGLVVQDSYFKEVHFDLPKILTEMGGNLNRGSQRLDYYVARTKAAIHPSARNYRATFSATESLIVFGEKED
jgi:SAM-dependent methyltransferase